MFGNIAGVALASLLLVMPTAQAASTVSGTLGWVYQETQAGGAPGAYDLRINFGNTIVCNSNMWAYVNLSDANYRGILAIALTAKVSGTVLAVSVQQDASGYCQILSAWIN